MAPCMLLDFRNTSTEYKKIQNSEIYTKWALETTISSVKTFKRVSKFTENIMAVYSLYIAKRMGEIDCNGLDEPRVTWTGGVTRTGPRQ